MALILKDRVKETTTTTSTGTVTLLGAADGYQSFAAIGNGNTTYYTIAAQTGTEWEVGIGTYTSSGTTLSRDTVLSSSNGGSLVNFSAGIKDVFVTQPSEKAVYTNASDVVNTSGNGANTVAFTNINASTVNASSFVGNGVAITAINASNLTTGTIDNARTTASSANGANTIVLRDASGDFSANIITANGFTGNGANLSAINASNISSGTVATARLGSGTANASTFLRGDQTYAVPAEFASGTVLLFYQAAAPTGWTQVTSQNNKALRVVSGTGGGTGGSVAFTTAFTSQGVAGTVSTSVNAFTPSGSVSTSTSINNTTAGGSVSVSLASGGGVSSYTLSTSEIPSHNHGWAAFTAYCGSGGHARVFSANNNEGGYSGDYVDNYYTGGSGSHAHGFTNPSYSGSFSGSAHNHTASSSSSFSGNSVTPTASSSFSGTAINLAVQYIDIIMCSKN